MLPNCIFYVDIRSTSCSDSHSCKQGSVSFSSITLLSVFTLTFLNAVFQHCSLTLDILSKRFTVPIILPATNLLYAFSPASCLPRISTFTESCITDFVTILTNSPFLPFKGLVAVMTAVNCLIFCCCRGADVTDKSWWCFLPACAVLLCLLRNGIDELALVQPGRTLSTF